MGNGVSRRRRLIAWLGGKARNVASPFKSAYETVTAKSVPDKTTPEFRPALTVGVAAILLATALATGIYYWLAWYAGPITRAGRLEYVKTTLTITGFAGLILGAVYAYRNQRISEANSHRSDFAAKNERFEKAAAQLGSDRAAVRLAGVYSMSHLADEWRDQRQTCINVLCAYLRMPAVAGDPEGLSSSDLEEREVRAAILSEIVDRLTIYEAERTYWIEYRFDLRWAVLHNADFSSCHLKNLDFTGVKFSGDTNFSDSIFDYPATFNRAEFLGDVLFDEVTFQYGADFYSTQFGGFSADFRAAVFKREANFTGNVMTEGQAVGARMSFTNAIFGGRASFDNRLFRADFSMVDAEVQTQVTMRKCEFDRDALFDGVQINAQREFGRRTGFIGRPTFNGEFSGDRSLFPNAQFALEEFALEPFSAEDVPPEDKHPEASG